MKTTRRTVTVSDNYDRTTRLSLGEPHYGSVSGRLQRCDEIGTGLFARALWIGRKHVVLLTYSQWATRDGRCTGDQYSLVTADDAHMIRRVFGNSVANEVLDALRVPVAESIDATEVTS